LHKLTIISALLCFSGTMIRCFSLLDPRSWWALYVVSIGQILVAIAGPIVCTAPTKLSSRWFPTDERTIATAIGTGFNNLGCGVAFIVAPYLVHAYGIELFFVFEAGFAALNLLLLLAYFPDGPPHPPTISASQDDESDLLTWSTFLRDLWSLRSNWSFFILICVGGWVTGMISAWQTMFQFILVPYFDEIFAGWLGFLLLVTMCVGGILGGILCDKFFQKRFRLILVLVLFIVTGFLMIFTLIFPSVLANPAPIVIPQWATTVIIIISGLIFGIAYPIFYEFGVELTYPLSPSVSSGVYTLFQNIFNALVLLTGAYIPVMWINVIATFSVLASILPLLVMKESYKRLEVDEKRKVEQVTIAMLSQS